MKNKALAIFLTIFLVLLFKPIGMAALFTPGAWLFRSGTDTFLQSWMGPNQGEGAGAGLVLTVDKTNRWMPILQSTAGTAGIEHAWYETTIDTVIDYSFTTNTTPAFWGTSTGEMTIPFYQPFYIAFKLGERAISNPRDTYGWAELIWDGYNLNLLDSAAENSGTGIIAGQYQVVPEPSSVSLLLVGTGIFYLRKKKCSHQESRAHSVERRHLRAIQS